MKKICLLLLAACLLLGFEAFAEGEYRFKDDLGREIALQRPERVAALLGSYAEVWFLAGGEICAAPEDAFEDFDLPLGEDAVNLGATKRLSLEALLAAEPDLVLASVNTAQHLEWMPTLESAGLTVAYFDVSGFEDYLRMLRICTDITGRSDLYGENGTAVQAEIEAVLDRHSGKEGPSVLVMRASSVSIRAKNSSVAVLGDMLASLNCENIADSDESLLENLSVESIFMMDPEHIFIVQSGDDREGTERNIEALFAENPLWRELSAVKNGRVHIMDKKLFNLKPNARWGEAYAILEEILYG